MFNLRNVFIETMFLLLSSYTCGLGALSAERRQPAPFLMFSALMLGAAFLFIEATEFARMVRIGAGPSRSGFLSAFFTLVGTHGVNVTGGLIACVSGSAGDRQGPTSRRLTICSGVYLLRRILFLAFRRRRALFLRHDAQRQPPF
jgi:heme/copper-type cytochrome/quinol oxidase subunit 3